MTIQWKRILFVEDDESSHELVALTLSEYKLTTVLNFSNGLSQARKQDFDLYILDNWLPDGNGIELCLLIREFDQQTPILFYSAAALDRDIQAALNAGAQDYLIKPVSPDDLKKTVERLISCDNGMAARFG